MQVILMPVMKPQTGMSRMSIGESRALAFGLQVIELGGQKAVLDEEGAALHLDTSGVGEIGGEDSCL